MTGRDEASDETSDETRARNEALDRLRAELRTWPLPPGPPLVQALLVLAGLGIGVLLVIFVLSPLDHP